MNRTTRRHLPVASALAAVLSMATGPALAETIIYSAEMMGEGVEGSGVAAVAYDTETNVLSWDITFGGLSGPVTAAHIHGPAAAGENAGIVLGFDEIGDGEITGSQIIDAEIAGHLASEMLYVNIHTELYRGGEIRGQLVPDTGEE